MSIDDELRAVGFTQTKTPGRWVLQCGASVIFCDQQGAGGRFYGYTKEDKAIPRPLVENLPQVRRVRRAIAASTCKTLDVFQ